MTTTVSMKTTIAVLGVGRMGSPMATRLIGAGFKVRLWNRSFESLAPLIERGAHAAESPSDAAHGADVVLTMLPDGAVVRNVMEGTHGALATMGPGAVWLQMSSVGVEWAEMLKVLADAHGVTYVDAPVSGSIGPAKDGTLIVLASGPDDAHERVAPVFEALGSETVWLGPAGAGSRAKLVLNNWLVDLVESTAETLHFAQGLGLDPNVIVRLLNDAPIGSPYAVAKARSMLAGDFTANFALRLALKDAKLSLEAAKSANIDLRLTDSLVGSWQRAVDAGRGDEDVSTVYRK
ncbi:MAG: beta-hydroxyacid dehydrogenase, 3-hydroxyisobutyrate dehydrogenase [Acidimicrobiaceae bacterium]|nr:beta-hydroxyacid dehydrogenase, 3-hydroxyisobutyrate dehydrogenase [Acidimicrobiaceae bacterium]